VLSEAEVSGIGHLALGIVSFSSFFLLQQEEEGTRNEERGTGNEERGTRNGEREKERES
jgi:hypothetical protein